ncbi:MAG: acetyl-CoA carboxylase biotin carboxyl carrier protein [Candidatus Binataceae bacterium]|jgi:acetyl-CoA carboxylase biotin carboxyl carrier protein|nr:acetyl-CoA carboxylase biotin carboxyl carrier protein [Candidatus Binataceae bacterium]
MEVRELKTLLALMQDFGLVELEIEDKKGKVRLVRAGVAASATATPPAAIAGPKEIAAKAFELRTAKEASKPTASSGNGARGSEPPAIAENQKLVVSPMVGTFYRAASPDSDPFVEEGDSVRKGQALCIIEAMKMMNEIEADAGGRIVRILCENGQPIEYGQPLMVLEIG